MDWLAFKCIANKEMRYLVKEQMAGFLLLIETTEIYVFKEVHQIIADIAV